MCNAGIYVVYVRMFYATVRLYAGVTLKCLPDEKSARGEINTKLICLLLIKILPAP